MVTEVDYYRHEDGLSWQFADNTIPDGALMFYATEIRKIGKDDPKIYAYVRIGIPGGRTVAADDLRIRDSEQRGKLANQAATALLGGNHASAHAIVMRERMLVFCDGLWEFWVGSDSGDWVDGDEEPSAPRWAVPGFVLDGGTGIHFGNAGDGKSTVDRLLAVSLQNGIPSLFPIAEQGNVIWVNAEESPDEHKRQLGNINAVLGLPRSQPLFTLDARGVGIHDLAPRLRAAVAKVDAQHIFVDSLSRLAQGLSLNDNATATGIIDSIAGLGCSVTWIGHTGQANQHRLAGSKHFENAARLMVRIQGRISPGEAGHLRRGVRAEVTKLNGGSSPRPSFLTIDYDEQYGAKSARHADSYEWPLLHCGYTSENGRQCSRMTWDGMSAEDGPRCARHRYEESSDS